MRGDGEVHAPLARARLRAAVLTVRAQKLGDRLAGARQALAVRLGRDAQHVGRGGAVHLEHGPQHVGAAAVGVEALQHHVRARQLQLARQHAAVDPFGQVGDVLRALVDDVGPVHLEAERGVRELMRAAVLEVVHGDAVHPCGERALLAKRREPGHDLDRDLLARVLGVVDGAQEPERKVEHEPARGPQQFLQRLAVACDGLVHQVELRFFR